MSRSTDDLRITKATEVIAPERLIDELPPSKAAVKTVLSARRTIQNILAGRDRRLLVISGPCSIHDPKAALEFATRLLELKRRHDKELFVMMRVYFEKPRTTVGWKGLINDPGLDNSFRIDEGLHLARRLLLDINEMGVAAGTEYLDPISPQYVSDLISWGAIGARTTESQVHRELASGLSCPIGFKNATNGDVQVAVDAIVSSSNPHHFLGVTKSGLSAILATAGNPDCHVILRGGNGHPNYDLAAISDTADRLQKASLNTVMIVDCSHANSDKDHQRQTLVCDEVAAQIEGGEARVIGIMLESHLQAGRQNLVSGKALTYGLSITDACMGWEQTEIALGRLAIAVATRNAADGNT